MFHITRSVNLLEYWLDKTVVEDEFVLGTLSEPADAAEVDFGVVTEAVVEDLDSAKSRSEIG